MPVHDDTSIRSEFLPVGRPMLGDEERDEMLDTLKSDWLSKGPKTKLFEEQFKEYVNSAYAVSVSSCTAGLHVALRSAGVKEGDEVITTPMTFVATCNAILYCGARPVLVDIYPDDLNICVEKIKSKITARTKAIIPVHFAGHPCEMDGIMDIAKEHGLIVIEDAAHAIGSEYRGKKIGSIGDMTVFSFYATKNITTGDGGMISTNNEEYAVKAGIFSFHGLSSDAWQRYAPQSKGVYETVELGYKYNMTDIQASIGIHQLKKVDRFIDIRQKYAHIYDEELSGIPCISITKMKQYVKHSRHIYPIVLDIDKLKISRNDFIEAMKKENIGCSVHFMAIHKHKYYREEIKIDSSDLSTASYVSDRVLSLPLYPKMTEKDVYDVIKAVNKLIRIYNK